MNITLLLQGRLKIIRWFIANGTLRVRQAESSPRPTSEEEKEFSSFSDEFSLYILLKFRHLWIVKLHFYKT